MKLKLTRLVLTLVAGLAVLFATTATQASFPWTAYQPKAPQSLIKED